MNTVKLKIKLKSLATEATIIRREERKLLSHSRSTAKYQNAHAVTPQLYFDLHYHRTYDVRTEARATGWVYAYLRGRPFSCIETYPYDKLSFHHIRLKQRAETMLKKYGTKDQQAGFEAWLTTAVEQDMAA